jgi:hypothetical protein
MNKRIKELILQSVTFRLDPDSECYEAIVCPEDLEHLAQLIVRECAEQVDWILAEGGKTQGDVIRQHLGVEQ